MLSITAICDQYAWLYQSKIDEPDSTWDHVLPVDGAYCAIKRIETVDYVMFRGSTTLLDWIEDFKDCALPVEDPELGPVHPGARAGVELVRTQLDGLVGPSVTVVGHSLGAMHAALYTGLRVNKGLPVQRLVMFGEPRSGGPRLSQIIVDGAVTVQSFRNARPRKTPGENVPHDIVTDVARAILPDLPYQHISDPLTDCYHEPRADDLWLAFKWHHFGHYCRAFGAAAPQALALPV